MRIRGNSPYVIVTALCHETVMIAGEIESWFVCVLAAVAERNHVTVAAWLLFEPCRSTESAHPGELPEQPDMRPDAVVEAHFLELLVRAVHLVVVQAEA